MNQENLLSVSNIARELSTGKATIKFLLKRFKPYIPCERREGQPLYPPETINILFKIQEKLAMGALPSDIEKDFNTPDSPAMQLTSAAFEKQPENGDIRLSNDGLTLLKSLVSDIGEQQKRIATAHEKRAQAEERKAVAIEKRASAEEKKAEAMNNIAAALQEMNKIRSNDPAAQQIVHQAATVIASDEFDETETDLSSLLDEDEMIESGADNDLLSDVSDIDFDQELEDSLSDPLGEIDEDFYDDDDLILDDLSSLIEEESILDDSDDIQPELDDLSSLINDKQNDEQENEPLDDLSLLIEEPADDDSSPENKNNQKSVTPLDDLSKLIDQNAASVKTEPAETLVEGDLDDLSKLIDSPENSGPDVPVSELDDLSLLIDQPSDETPEKSNDVPKIKMEISPEDGLEKYKAAVMKVIIGLKTDGLNVEQTTDRLNTNKIKTLSGKSEWSQKAISQVYKFIEAAK